MNNQFYEFQSLTGSIHTKITNDTFLFDSAFQSLTGSIHTCDFVIFAIEFCLFQSLTGSIHTQKGFG